MTRSVVTGAAGFVGSHLAERLCQLGHDVVGIDSFTDYYPEQAKRRNVEGLVAREEFRLLEQDVAHVDWSRVLVDVDYVFHLAAQPGVRASWGADFATYVRQNVLATQALLDAARGSSIRRLVFASSSSVYGDTDALPTAEDTPLRPLSPYGVTKVAGEHLCSAYAQAYDIPVVSLRLFTVYGPRQRPDMAIYRFLDAVAAGRPIAVYGDGEQTRDFTYVSDVVEALTLAAGVAPRRRVYNVCGGSRITVNELLRVIADVTGIEANVGYVERAVGDVRHTFGDNRLVLEDLGFATKTELREGVAREWEWLRGSGGAVMA